MVHLQPARRSEPVWPKYSNARSRPANRIASLPPRRRGPSIAYLDDLGRLLAHQRAGYGTSCPIGSGKQRRINDMHVARRYGTARMAEHGRDSGFRVSQRVRSGGEGMAQGVQRDALELGPLGNPLPGLWQALVGSTSVATPEYRIFLRVTWQRIQEIRGGLAQRP